MAETFLNVSLERVVRRNTDGSVRLGLRGIADIRNAKVDVAALERFLIWRSARGCWSGGQVNRSEWRAYNGVAVGVILFERCPRIDGMARRSNLGLIEWEWNYLMAAEVADVADVDSEIVARLPLNIESLVHRIGQFVGPVVDGE